MRRKLGVLVRELRLKARELRLSAREVPLFARNLPNVARELQLKRRTLPRRVSIRNRKLDMLGVMWRPPPSFPFALPLLVLAACASKPTAPAKGPTEAAWGDVTAQVPGFVRELRMLDVTLPGGAHAKLDALITRPAVEDPVPLILWSHSRPPAAERPDMTPTTFSGMALALARRGYGVAVVFRRGYGRSPGPAVDGTGSCTNPTYEAGATHAAEDVVGAVKALSAEPWVDPSKVVVLGSGALSGGLAALATPAALGTDAPTLRGVVAVSSWNVNVSKAPDPICHEEQVAAALTSLGTRARVPALWLEMPNELHFGEDFARHMTDAYKAGGAPIELVMSPPFDAKRVDPWWPAMTPFLERLGLPTAEPDPTKVVENPVIATPASLDEKGQKAFAEYLATDGFEKAFAVGASGWGRSYRQRTMTDAMYKAVQTCKEAGNRGCVPYAVGNEYAPGVKDHPPVIWVRGVCYHRTGHIREGYWCWVRNDQK